MLVVPSLQLGTGKTTAVRLVGKSCLSVRLSVRARFGHISATDRPIDFLFDPRVEFSGTVDRMDLLPVGPSARWRLAAILENSQLTAGYWQNGCCPVGW